MTTATAKRITSATIDSFIRRNAGHLQILVKSDFDGMTDCVTANGSARFVAVSQSDNPCKNNRGLRGVWFVGGSRNYFNRFVSETMNGFDVSNCCGSWTIAVPN